MPFGGLLSAGIGLGTSLLGGVLGSSAASKAAKQQQENANRVAGMDSQAASGAQSGEGAAVGIANTGLSNAYDTQRQTLAGVYGQQQQALQPYQQVGNTAAQGLNTALAPGGTLAQQFSFNPQDLQNDPGYQFQLKQGEQAVQRAASANGTLGTGGTLKAMNNYSQGLAGTSYQQAYQRAQNTFQTNQDTTLKNLTAGTNVGMGATGMFNQAGQQFASGTDAAAGAFGSGTSANTLRASEYGGNVGMEGAQLAGAALTGGANAGAAGTMGAANAWSGALGGVGQAAQNYATNQTLQDIYGQQGGSGTPPGFLPYSSAKPFVPPGGGAPPNPSLYMPPMPSGPGWNPVQPAP